MAIRKIMALGAGCALLFLCGCQTPYVKPKLIAFQSRVDAVHDWEKLAYRLVDMRPEGKPFPAVFPLPNAASTLPLGSTPFYVTYGAVDNCGNPAHCEDAASAFAQAFKKLLEKALVSRGYTVVQKPQGAVIVRFDAQPFLYDANHNSHFLESATVDAVVAGIAGQFRSIGNFDTGAAVALGATPFIDLLAEMDDKTNAEVLVSITVSDDVAVKNKLTVADAAGTTANRRILFRNTETLYVKPSDLQFYITPVPLALLKMRGPEGEGR